MKIFFSDICQINVLGGSDSIFQLPVIVITNKAFRKIKYLVDLCEYEISGFGTVERTDQNVFLIDNIFITKQFTSTSGDHVETDSEALNHFIYDLISKGGDPSKIKFQWHSHANIEAFFSSEDIDTIGNYTNDFMISFVINKKGQCSCRLDIFKPFNLSLELPLFVKIPALYSDSLREQYRREIEDNVHVKFSPGIQVSKNSIVQKKRFYYIKAENIFFDLV